MIIQSEFQPAWWCRNRHLQTLWPLFTNIRQCQVEIKRERIELPDGDFLDLDWTTGEKGPIVLIMHGLGGSAESSYAKGLLNAVHAANWRGVVMHFRGCSGEWNRLPRAYHSGETGDIHFIVDTLLAREPNTPIVAVGYSLGGNVLLKWLGESSQQNPLTAAIAVSVPFELDKCAQYMDHGLARVYQHKMVRDLQQATLKKFRDRSCPIDLSHVQEYTSFLTFDNFVTAPLHGFQDAYHYYADSSSRQYLKHIMIPTLIIHAEDDPLMPPEVIPSIDELSSAITLEIAKHGGHVGFITGHMPGHGESWLEGRIVQHLRGVFTKQANTRPS